MAKLKVTEHRKGLEDHGERWRIERRFRPEPAELDDKGNVVKPSPGYFWVVYELMDNQPVKHSETGEHMKTVPVPGVPEELLYHHPIVKDRFTGTAARTTHAQTWVPRFAGLEEEARAFLEKNAR